MKILKINYTLLLFSSILISSCSTTVIDKVVPPPERITFTKNIKPIVDANCTMTCHSPTTQLDAGLDLSTYATFRAATENRGVVSRIKNTGAPMPPAPNNMLSDTDIAIIEKWISDGYLEN